MTVQLIRKVRDKQPTKFVGVDWSNPNLASFYYIAISGGMGLGSVVWVDRKNRVYNCTAKTGKSTSAGLGGFYTGANSGTITGSASLPNNSRTLWLFGNSAGSGDVVEATIANASGNQISIKNGVLTGSIRTYDGTFSTSTINKTGVLSAFLTWDQPNNIGTLYVGKETPITVATTSTWDINNNLVSVFSAQESSVILGGIATGVLPASVRLSLSENPWQIFEPETIPLFFSTSGGGATNLSIFDALHSHAGDNLTFSLDTYLAAQDSTHAHAADNLTLDASTAISLILSDTLHGLSSDVIAFITGSYLAVVDSLHSHSADVVTLATSAFLAVAEALHAHAADNVTLDTSNATPLTLQEALHAHSTNNIAFTLTTWLAIAEAVHAHLADTIALSSEELLAIAEALHAHASDALVLSLPPPPGACPSTAEIVAAILAAAQLTPIHANIMQINSVGVDGAGVPGNEWGPV